MGRLCSLSPWRHGGIGLCLALGTLAEIAGGFFWCIRSAPLGTELRPINFGQVGHHAFNRCFCHSESINLWYLIKRQKAWFSIVVHLSHTSPSIRLSIVKSVFYVTAMVCLSNSDYYTVLSFCQVQFNFREELRFQNQIKSFQKSTRFFWGDRKRKEIIWKSSTAIKKKYILFFCLCKLQ